MNAEITSMMKNMLKPAYDFAVQIQKDSREILSKKKISDQDFRRLQVKQSYLMSIATQLQIQNVEEMISSMEDLMD